MDQLTFNEDDQDGRQDRPRTHASHQRDAADANTLRAQGWERSPAR